MAPQARALAVLAEDPSSIPTTHMAAHKYLELPKKNQTNKKEVNIPFCSVPFLTFYVTVYFTFAKLLFTLNNTTSTPFRISMLTASFSKIRVRTQNVSADNWVLDTSS